ncbi:DUF397 domain-containing protein [Glycomyces terrestris]|uniref:DUF397 domain-containing protein n=1 Tax=Glycomyces terrestris TaxID=2493553 RepID=A0A426V4C9_9ACTN|nr:DUF397 domain-containing protein [Glycomyces terrestris]RRS01764.1 DUF397 domain-containing protein [Glycomyces terrestris]
MLTENWKKSSRSGNQGGACVEARAHSGVAQVRDTKLGESSPILEASAADWTALLAAATRLDGVQDQRPPRHRGPFGFQPALHPRPRTGSVPYSQTCSR